MLIESLPIIDLAFVDLRDKCSLVISDLSVYSGSIPNSSHLVMQITPPGYPKINVNFTAGEVNVFKCVDLGITCSDTGCTPLPDGIYVIVYTVYDINMTAYSIEVKGIKIDTIKCRYQHAFVKIDMKCDCYSHEQRVYKEELRRIKLYVDGCVAQSNMSNYVLSQQLYQKADYLLSKIDCNKLNCGC